MGTFRASVAITAGAMDTPDERHRLRSPEKFLARAAPGASIGVEQVLPLDHRRAEGAVAGLVEEHGQGVPVDVDHASTSERLVPDRLAGAVGLRLVVGCSVVGCLLVESLLDRGPRATVVAVAAAPGPHVTEVVQQQLPAAAP